MTVFDGMVRNECLSSSPIHKFSCRRFELIFFGFLTPFNGAFGELRKNIERKGTCAEREHKHFKSFAANGGHLLNDV